MESLQYGVPITNKELATLADHIKKLHSFHNYRSHYQIEFIKEKSV